MEQKYTDNDSQGYLDAVNNFYGDVGEIFQNDTIDQRKYNHSKLLTFNGKATYTEPIGNNKYVILNYGISNTTSSADRSTYDYNDGKYDVLNPLLTNDYDFLVTTNAGGIAYRIAKKKIQPFIRERPGFPGLYTER